MEVTVVDTMRYADRLKASGVESDQAEAMSRALNDELAGGVATKDDLRHAVDELKTELKTEIAKVDAKVTTVDGKFEALRDSFETQSRHVFLVLALIAALGLYNAVAPHVSAKTPATVDAEKIVATAQTQGG